MTAPQLKRFTTGSAAVLLCVRHLSCSSDPVAPELVGFFALGTVDGVSLPAGLPCTGSTACDAAVRAEYLPALVALEAAHS